MVGLVFKSAQLNMRTTPFVVFAILLTSGQVSGEWSPARIVVGSNMQDYANRHNVQSPCAICGVDGKSKTKLETLSLLYTGNTIFISNDTHQ